MCRSRSRTSQGLGGCSITIRACRSMTASHVSWTGMNIKLPDGDFGAYIFDCDGTLADTMPLHYKAWCEALKEHNAEFPEALFYELGGVTTEHVVKILNERHGHSMPVKETARFK